ncbi:MAG: hypothetical protein ACRC8B_22730 [Aeromonas sobria]|uniref:hypothetical protein n=1 Tax=Aeromonas sobria TaxID=646 RepID=UPI003F30BF42
MKDRDSNETGQPHASSISPDAASREQGIDPLNTEDYGTLVKLDAVTRLIHSGEVRSHSKVKVSTDTRYVIEIEVVKRGAGLSDLPPSMAFEPTL